MDRKIIHNLFSGIDEHLVGELCDIIELCEEIEYPVFSKYFYPPLIKEKLKKLNRKDIVFSFCSLEENSEKSMVMAKPRDFDMEIEYPTIYFKITNKSKFKELKHKDYLGAIMSLGIKRELMGDLIVEGNSCYGIINSEIYEYLEKDLEIIGRNPVKIEKIEGKEIPKIKYETLNLSVASVRIDCVVSEILNISRTRTNEMIEKGEVSKNYTQIKEKSSILEQGDTITVRGSGKFIFEELVGENKKGKLKIKIKKFI